MSLDIERAIDRLIVALDNPDLNAAEDLLDRLRGKVRFFKVGSALFTRCGPAAIEAVHRRGGDQAERTHTGHRQLQRPRDRCRGKGQNMHV